MQRSSKKLSVANRAWIAGCIDENNTRETRKPLAAIGNRLGVSQQTVSDINIQHIKKGLPIEPKQVKQPLRATTETDRRHIATIAKREPGITTTAIQRQLPRRISRTTIWRTLRRAAFQHYRANQKPALTARQMKARLDWAKEREDWTVDDWARVIYTDETAVALQPPYSNRHGVWRPKGRNHARDGRYARRKTAGGGSMSFWGGFCFDDHTDLVPLPSGYTRHDYIKLVLEDELDDFVKHRRGREVDPDVSVLEDAAPWHTAGESTEAFHRLGFRRHQHPVRSPDLNPIENIWKPLKNHYFDYIAQGQPRWIPKTKDAKMALMVKVQEKLRPYWKLLVRRMGPRLVRGMPARVKAVIENEGDITRW